MAYVAKDEGQTAKRYDHPRLIATYSIDALRAEAAISLTYESDRTLKREIETVTEPIQRLGGIRTG
jgi:hypothetical protein